MFQRLLNDNPGAQTTTIAARTLVEEPESDMHALKRSRAAIEAEIDGMQGQLDKANEDYRALRKKHGRDLNWEENNMVEGAIRRVYAGSPLALAIMESRDRCDELRAAIEPKRAEVEELTKKIQVIERELPGRLRREALEAVLPLAFKFIDALCVAAAHEREYVSLGGNVEQSVPWEFGLSGGEGILLETVMSRWLKALKSEGIKIPGGAISDDARHLPAPASAHARVQTDAGYLGHATKCGSGGGFGAGFRKGYMTRARTF